LNHLQFVLKVSFGPYGEKCWNVFIKNLNFFSAEERKTWISWMTWG